MGHAHHFLSRLDRVSLPEVELALSLYRDEGLLRYLFDRANIPEQTPRVALSLEDPVEGPFLIITRNGKFVTCLGRGMSPGEWPIITRGQLDAIATKVHDLRERMEMATSLVGSKSVKALIRRVYDAADELTREEFLAISALQPMYATKFLSLYLGAGVDLSDARDKLIPILRKTDKPKPIYHDLLRAYWNTLWALGNFAVLASMDGAAGLPKELVAMFGDQTSFSWAAVRQGIVPIALRGVWSAARIGKPFLVGYKRLYQVAMSRLQNMDSTAGLLAIGARHSRLRAEVEKALGADIPEEIKGTVDGTVAKAIRDIARIYMKIDREATPVLLDVEKQIGAKIAVAISKEGKLPNFKYTRVEDVPPETARLLAINGNWSFLEGASNADAVMAFLGMIFGVARGAPEDMYFPRETQRQLHTPWTPDMSVSVLRKMVPDHYDPRTVVPPEGPARKAPCPCGSGKKYKRCCGEGKGDANKDE